MDAQAILLKLGWSGPGNPLNPNARPGATSGLGLTRPILVARRKGNAGVGNKTTKDPTNQWWLRGFEDALKGVGAAARPPTAAPAPNALTSELYRFFVRGEVVAGTMGDVHMGDGVGKRKRDGDDDGDDTNGKKHGEKKETKEERRVRKEERRKRKEERRVKREEKVKRREEREARRADRKLRREKKAAAKLLKRRTEGEEDAPRPQYEDYPTPPVTEQEQEPEQEQTGAKVKTQKKKDRKDKKTKEEEKKKKKKTPKESKKRKTREEASSDAAPKKVKKSKAAE
ncbi:hypothetical protein BP00DRAFT_424838 [Aspergillus indologenus CBS 114.80]|uniref:G-patch domain-containing protein n=1 Tax=Aspergillus indologenus CBS 114.80 TaxID=1450541 RepID=A0A2V5I7I2_9EURO|nr:hypothetical protein BP00DRAFT_424838 [Aspergillus indologenus CBS 114.80]